jgi:serine/threonine-protein kinase HipA
MTWRVDRDKRILEMAVFSGARGQIDLVGMLTFQIGANGSRQGIFRYDQHWLKQEYAAPLFASGLPLIRQVRSIPPFEVPLPFYDTSPDGWGKAILHLAYPNIDLGAPEYIGVAGNNRVGDLLFGPNADGPAVYVPADAMLDLPKDDDAIDDLMDAADAVENGIATRSHLARLLNSAADIGGARPKARIIADGKPSILKMPARDDGFNVQKVEAACLSVARSAGIDVPAHHLIEIGGRTALVVERFDRDGALRRPFTSAATIMGDPPHSYSSGASYAGLAIAARRAGIMECAGELFRRMLLNCFVNNTDDHLHNHGFVRIGNQWRLSPLFDVVTQRKRGLVLRPARGVTTEANPETAMKAYPQFGLSEDEAWSIYTEVSSAAETFRDWLGHYGVSDADMSTILSLAPYAIQAKKVTSRTLRDTSCDNSP